MAFRGDGQIEGDEIRVVMTRILVGKRGAGFGIFSPDSLAFAADWVIGSWFGERVGSLGRC